MKLPSRTVCVVTERKRKRKRLVPRSVDLLINVGERPESTNSANLKSSDNEKRRRFD
jgi:4-hydroxy-3-methylbut-2-enyl diphosphate reductase IspH